MAVWKSKSAAAVSSSIFHSLSLSIMKLLFRFIVILSVFAMAACTTLFIQETELSAVSRRSMKLEYSRVQFENGEICMWGNLVTDAEASHFPWIGDVSGPATFLWTEGGVEKSTTLTIPPRRGNKLIFEILPTDVVTAEWGRMN
jgi:hypothetical protein